MGVSRRTLLRSWTLAPIGVGASALLGAAPAHAEPLIRIAVGRFRGKLELEGAGLHLRAGDGSVLHARDRVTLSAERGGVSVGQKRSTHDLVRIRAEGEIALRGHRYRRFLEIQWREVEGTPELLVVHPLPLEIYVSGIVASELPHQWPEEALKVQAICARTYAIWQKFRRLELPYHLESSVLDQVYQGAQREHEGAHRAVADTRGQLLVHARRPVQAYFHSSCGGHTESAAEGWGNALAYLPGVSCAYCQKSPLYRWKAKLSRKELDAALTPLLREPATRLRVIERSTHKRVLRVRVEGKGNAITLHGNKLRQVCGYNRLWSTWLTHLELGPQGLSAEGRGAGHGVGMCQWGARGMADAGFAHTDILAHYYPGAAIRPMY